MHTAETNYAFGFAWYLHPEDLETRNDKVARHLQNALEIDPDHKFALLYLGHHYYDRRQFADALDVLSSFQDREFSALGQGWRDSKVSELILCCMLQLGDRKNIHHAVYRFCDALTQCDEGMHPNPDELAQTLVEKLTCMGKK
jgi:tetratricopeptide (TPR) repeat protein